ncbi:PhzF family phenazine biosynthesis protein [Nocardioides daedukensis]|uniref:PhzF family phenazine biosynthesis protein n=1 Tax=Nocardioides daedukensis TaxID=634462 RepID=A0A7Y9S308_9ACTN|nr:PhzF family phenazine biosynthesis protein [Nocardioides daedukensis]NYG59168.1 PhzF family phenazine biosynthesis protein [Nocardioides daedukensis]
MTADASSQGPSRAFSQVDVFAPEPLTGNPVAVVHDATGMSEEQMAAFANWTNLSETTFLLPASDPRADYRLRIFTPARELPFAGHPTLGSAHAWLEQGGVPASEDVIVQECGLGLVTLRRTPSGLAFRAPDLLRSGPVDDATLAQAVDALGVAPDRVVDANWVDNGPGWLGVLLRSADDVLAIDPDLGVMGDLRVGVIGPHGPGGPADYEVRAFVPSLSVAEDPVTGSLNAGLAVWLVGAGVLPASYSVRQGTALGRRGDVRISSNAEGELWVGGTSRTVISGRLQL